MPKPDSVYSAQSDNTFWKWGNPQQSFHLSDFPKFKSFLEHQWNTQLTDDFRPPDLISTLAESRFSSQDFQRCFPALHLSKFNNSVASRLRYSMGKSYHDLIRIFTGKLPPLADFIIFPEDDKDIVHILEQASRHQIQIIPYSGGSNVTGALQPTVNSPCCVVNMQRMNRLISVDKVSHTAVFETGIFGPDIEKTLNPRGFTLGHFPQSFEYSTLGGWLATRSGGQESGQYGKIEDMVLGLKAIAPAGIIETASYPRHASGIDTFRLFIGSEGTLGIITQATLHIRPLPASYQWVVCLFKSFEGAVEVIRRLVQENIRPGILRLSDETETLLFSKMRSEEPRGLKKLVASFLKSRLMRKGFSRPSILMMRFALHNKADSCFPKAAARFLQSAGAFLLPASAAGNWEAHRFTLPYLRDTLVEHRILIDTFETVGRWSDVPRIYAHVRSALAHSDFYAQGGFLLCHISHVYDSGACLYFTMLVRQRKGFEAEQWEEYKTLVTEALVQAGGAVSHHHGVGMDHLSWYRKQTAAYEKKLLRAIKTHLDPHHILNPGKLFDET